MSSKRLFLLVEGNDDERFFSKVIVPKFKGIYEWVEVWKYSQQGKKRVKNFSEVSKQCEPIIFTSGILTNRLA